MLDACIVASLLELLAHSMGQSPYEKVFGQLVLLSYDISAFTLVAYQRHHL